MFSRFFVFALSAFFLSGCATTNRKSALEFQQCQNRVSLLEGEVADLEYALQGKGSEGYRRSGSVQKPNAGSAYTASQIQKALKSAGYYNGPLDGKIGAKTQEAIMKFQKDNGLKVDGKVGRMTWSELKPYLD
ncbi:MAG TPA: hypothetical protein DD723_00800 [Candidatus Omnitrophica bacterium]|nr:hypothetical protein [Candidatus Omnitrophota bacterium]